MSFKPAISVKPINFILFGLFLAQCSATDKKKTNFVILFADDIGWGDLGANWFPNRELTPHLNQLAENGMRLTDFHSGAAVCTPSRASLLTGRLGLRTGVVKNFSPYSVSGLPLNETTMAEVLKSNGYATGMVGKWHLGMTEKYHPNSRGFQHYFGLPYSNDMGCLETKAYNHPMCLPCQCKGYKSCNRSAEMEKKSKCGYSDLALPLFENFTIIEQPPDLEKLSRQYATAADNFINYSAMSNQPFLLYIAFAHMHVPLAYEGMHQSKKDTIYANTLRDLDHTIGNIIASLKAQNVYDDTLIWFTGDNGPWAEKCQYSGSPGPFLGSWLTDTFGGGSTAKATTWEAGHREPTVVSWPNRIKPNTTSSALTSALDIFPTILKIANISLPEDRRYDGIDISDLLLSLTDEAHKVLYHPNSGGVPDNGAIDTIRMGDYKAFWKTGGSKTDCNGRIAKLTLHDPPLIFNIKEDLEEKYPVTKSTCDFYDDLVKSFLNLRESIHVDIKADNTTVTDYSKDVSVRPCCNKDHPCCECR